MTAPLLFRGDPQEGDACRPGGKGRNRTLADRAVERSQGAATPLPDDKLTEVEEPGSD